MLRNQPSAVIRDGDNRLLLTVIERELIRGQRDAGGFYLVFTNTYRQRGRFRIAVVAVAQHLPRNGVCADRKLRGDCGGVIPAVHRVVHRAVVGNACLNQVLTLAVVLESGYFLGSGNRWSLFRDLKGGCAVYDVVAAVVIADGDRGCTGVHVVPVGYAVLWLGGAGAVDHLAVILDSDGGGFRRTVINKESRGQRDGGGDFLRLDGHGHLTGSGIGVVGVALYHVIHGIGARVCPLGNGLRIGIRIILVGIRIHHRAAGGGAYVHQVLGLPGIGQILGRRGLGQHRAGFLDGKLHLHVNKGIVAALL